MKKKKSRRKKTISDEEAVSITTGYILNLAIATLLIGSLVLMSQSTVNDVRESSADPQMKVIAEKIATNLATADRIATTSPNSNFTMKFDLPEDVSSQSYVVNITEDTGSGDTGTVSVRMASSNRKIIVDYNTRVPTQKVNFASGQEMVVNYVGPPPPPGNYKTFKIIEEGEA